MLDTRDTLSIRKRSSSDSAPALPQGPVGLAGLGLMGQGIATCLLAHGYQVIAVDPSAAQHKRARTHVADALATMVRRKTLSAARQRGWEKRFKTTNNLRDLSSCWLVLESVPENLELKQKLFAELEAVVPARTVLATNTSSIPITVLQKPLRHPRRFLGMHWGEPAQILRYLEIIPGEQTARTSLRTAERFGASCDKEPTVLKKDIRGFLSNRLMYAMIREAFHLVDSGIADVETVDRSFRNDIGWWAALAGPFRWMDLTGIPAYGAVMEDLLPELSTSTEVPRLMRTMLKRKALGIQNQKGFYRYDARTARQWERRWVDFTYEIANLSKRHLP